MILPLLSLYLSAEVHNFSGRSADALASIVGRIHREELQSSGICVGNYNCTQQVPSSFPKPDEKLHRMFK